MKNGIKKLIFVLVISLGLFLTACNNNSDEKTVQKAYDDLKIGFTVSGDSLSLVTGNLTLPGTDGEVVIVWASSASSVVSNAGVVTRPDTNTNVKMTATLTLGEVVKQKAFDLTVKKRDWTLGDAQAELEAEYQNTLGSSSYLVTENLTLKTSLSNGVTVAWTSNNTTVITNNGVVARPTYEEGNEIVKLTATLTLNGATAPVEFNVTVAALPRVITLADIVEAVETQYSTFLGKDPLEITESLDLITTTSLGGTIVWGSSNEGLVSTSGVVTRPTFTQGNGAAMLTANISFGGEEDKVEFFVVVLASPESDEEVAEALLDFACIWPSNDGWTSAPSFLDEHTYKAVKYSFTWVSDTPSVLSTETFERPAIGADDVEVTITVSVVVNEKTFSRDVEFLVLAIYGGIHYESIAELLADESLLSAVGTSSAVYLNVHGLTVYAITGTSMFLNDATGLVYVYGASSAQVAAYPVGSVVDVYGSFYYYFGIPELVNGSGAQALILNPSAAEPTVVPISETHDGDSAITDKVGSLSTAAKPNEPKLEVITVRVKVVIDNGETGSVGNYNTFITDATYAGSDVIATKEGTTAKTYKTPTMVIYYGSPNKAAFEAFNGDVVTINVLVYGWRTDRLIYYVYFFGDSSDIVLSATDAEAVAKTKSTLSLPAIVAENTTLALPSEGVAGTSISWASSHPAIVSTTGVVTLPESGQTAVTLTATITRGEVSDTLALIVKVGELDASTIASAQSMAAGDSIKIQGIITAEDWYSTTSPSIYLQDATGGIMAYSISAIAGEVDLADIVIGNEIILEGKLALNAGVLQIGQALTTKITVVSTGNAVTPETLTSAKGAGVAAHHGTVVTISGILEAKIDATGGSTATRTFYLVTEAGEKVTLYSGLSNATLRATLHATLTAIPAGSKITVTAVLAMRNGDAQLVIYRAAEIAVGALIADGDLNAELKAYIAEAAKFPAAGNVLADIELLTTAPFGLTIEWTSSEPTIISNTGEFTSPATDTSVTLAYVVKQGETTLYSGNITVTAKGGMEDSTKVVMSYTGATANMVNGNNATTVGLDPSVFTVTSALNSATQHVGLNAAGQIRIYAVRASGDGNTLSVAIAEGYTIIGVKFVFGASTNSPVGTLTLGAASNELTSAELSNTTKDYTGLGITSFSLKNIQTGGSSNSQIYILSIEITYIAN